jgi:hypothetical protein
MLQQAAAYATAALAFSRQIEQKLRFQLRGLDRIAAMQ